jgi:hypothetical protein
VIVEAFDIPILSSTERLQRALLRWVDFCGLSGQFIVQSSALDALNECQMLDSRSFLIEVDGQDPSDWNVAWVGADVVFPIDARFQGALLDCVPDERFADLVTREYFDAVHYRRPSARRFSRRSGESADAMDQLIFPLREPDRANYVFVVGEAITGRSLFTKTSRAASSPGGPG